MYVQDGRDAVVKKAEDDLLKAKARYDRLQRIADNKVKSEEKKAGVVVRKAARLEKKLATRERAKKMYRYL